MSKETPIIEGTEMSFTIEGLLGIAKSVMYVKSGFWFDKKQYAVEYFYSGFVIYVKYDTDAQQEIAYLKSVELWKDKQQKLNNEIKNKIG